MNQFPGEKPSDRQREQKEDELLPSHHPRLSRSGNIEKEQCQTGRFRAGVIAKCLSASWAGVEAPQVVSAIETGFGPAFHRSLANPYPNDGCLTKWHFRRMTVALPVRRVIEVLFIVCVFFTQSMASKIVFVVEHDHPEEECHVETISGKVATYHHHHHQHSDKPSRDEVPNDKGPDDGSCPHPHCHHFSIGEAFCAPTFHLADQLGKSPGMSRSLPSREVLPDGPSFDLVKPPQLG